MSDTVKSWIEERRGIHSAATDGPWYKTPNDRILSESVQWPEGDDYDVAGGLGRQGAVVEAIHDFDGNAIVDAHNMFPRALNALEQVLEEHSRQELYEPCDSTACALDGGHDHIEVDYGEWVHADERVGWACFTCRGEDGEPSDWPCATVQAIEGAINE